MPGYKIKSNKKKVRPIEPVSVIDAFATPTKGRLLATIVFKQEYWSPKRTAYLTGPAAMRIGAALLAAGKLAVEQTELRKKVRKLEARAQIDGRKVRDLAAVVHANGYPRRKKKVGKAGGRKRIVNLGSPKVTPADVTSTETH